MQDPCRPLGVEPVLPEPPHGEPGPLRLGRGGGAGSRSRRDRRSPRSSPSPCSCRLRRRSPPGRGRHTVRAEPEQRTPHVPLAAGGIDVAAFRRPAEAARMRGQPTYRQGQSAVAVGGCAGYGGRHHRRGRRVALEPRPHSRRSHPEGLGSRSTDRRLRLPASCPCGVLVKAAFRRATQRAAPRLRPFWWGPLASAADPGVRRSGARRGGALVTPPRRLGAGTDRRRGRERRPGSEGRVGSRWAGACGVDYLFACSRHHRLFCSKRRTPGKRSIAWS